MICYRFNFLIKSEDQLTWVSNVKLRLETWNCSRNTYLVQQLTHFFSLKSK